MDIWGAVVKPEGIMQGSPFPMIAVPGGGIDQRAPWLGYDYGNNNYYMSWNDRRGGVDYDIYGSRVSTSGTVLDGTGVLLSGATGNQFRPTVTDRRPAAGINYHLIAWNDYRPGAQADVYGIRVDGTGAVLSSEIPISSNSGDKVFVTADVDWIRTKKNLVSWVDNRNGTDYDPYRAMVDQPGVVSGDYPTVGITSDALAQQQAQVVVYATNGTNDYGFLSVWMDNRNGTDYDIWGIKVWP
jgi:hypothetical protein